MEIDWDYNGVDRRADKRFREHMERSRPLKKSICVTYFFWLIGGVFGLHHLYLHRDRHAFVWWCTFGYFGFGWFSELFTIPRLVRDTNEDYRFMNSFMKKLKTFPSPPFSSSRFLGSILLSYLFGQLVLSAIPQEIFGGIDWGFLHWLIPFAMALGVWTVGNVGREEGVFWQCLVAAYLAYPIRYYIYDETYWCLATTFASALVFDSFSKKWRRESPKRNGLCKRGFRLSLAITVYLSLWSCYFVFNGKITDSDGDEVPVHEALNNFFASPWWADFKQTLQDTYRYGQHHGWYETWKEVFEQLDVDGERNAHKVLNVSGTASQPEITTAWRKLSKEFHPDKVKDPSKRHEAQERFMEIQQAYEVLSKIKSKRRSRNKKFNDDL